MYFFFYSQALLRFGFVMFFESPAAASIAPSLRSTAPRQSAALPDLGSVTLSSLAILSQPHIIKLLHTSDSYIIFPDTQQKTTPKPPSLPPTPTQPPIKRKKNSTLMPQRFSLKVINKTLCKVKLPPLLQGQASFAKKISTLLHL